MHYAILNMSAKVPLQPRHPTCVLCPHALKSFLQAKGCPVSAAVCHIAANGDEVYDGISLISESCSVQNHGKAYQSLVPAVEESNEVRQR